MLIPLMWFIFDETWDTGAATVYMTPTKVWGPLAFSYAPFLAAFPKTAFGLSAVALAWTGLRKWINPNLRVF